MKGAARAFREQGYYVFRNLLPKALRERLKEEALRLIEGDPFQTRELFKFHGSMVRIPHWSEPFAQLIALPCSTAAHESLGFPDIKWISGYVISKPPRGRALWWHQDWWAWDEACSVWPLAPQAFFMYYLQDTSERNGCLRVIPRSHRQRFDLHDHLPEAHSEEINHDPTDVAFIHHEQEVSLPVEAGDVIVGDARILHSTHANETDDERICLTLWYAPNFRQLPRILQAKMSAQILQPEEEPAGLPGPLLVNLLPDQQGLPIPGPYNRQPGEQLQNRDQTFKATKRK